MSYLSLYFSIKNHQYIICFFQRILFSMKARRQLTTFDSLFDYSSDEENNSLPTGGTQGELGEERGEVSEEELGGGVGTDVSKDGRSKRGQGGGKGGGRGQGKGRGSTRGGRGARGGRGQEEGGDKGRVTWEGVRGVGEK